jgi:hypothetical protein
LKSRTSRQFLPSRGAGLSTPCRANVVVDDGEVGVCTSCRPAAEPCSRGRYRQEPCPLPGTGPGKTACAVAGSGAEATQDRARQCFSFERIPCFTVTPVCKELTASEGCNRKTFKRNRTSVTNSRYSPPHPITAGRTTNPRPASIALFHIKRSRHLGAPDHVFDPAMCASQDSAVSQHDLISRSPTARNRGGWNPCRPARSPPPRGFRG